MEALTEVLLQQAMTPDAARRMAERSPFAGTVESVTDALRRYRDAGLGAVMFDWPAPFDRPTLEALAGPVRTALEADA